MAGHKGHDGPRAVWPERDRGGEAATGGRRSLAAPPPDRAIRAAGRAPAQPDRASATASGLADGHDQLLPLEEYVAVLRSAGFDAACLDLRAGPGAPGRAPVAGHYPPGVPATTDAGEEGACHLP